MSRAEFAARCGISEEDLYRIEHAIAPSSVAQLLKISRSLETTPCGVLEGFQPDPVLARLLEPVGLPVSDQMSADLVRHFNAIKDVRKRQSLAAVVRAAAGKY